MEPVKVCLKEAVFQKEDTRMTNDSKTRQSIGVGWPPAEDALCKHCGGRKDIGNPTGHCNHIYWPDALTDEAKIANGYVRVTTTTWEKPVS